MFNMVRFLTFSAPIHIVAPESGSWTHHHFLEFLGFAGGMYCNECIQVTVQKCLSPMGLAEREAGLAGTAYRNKVTIQQ